MTKTVLPSVISGVRVHALPTVLTAGSVFAFVALVRWTGMLQSLELQAYDRFLLARSNEPPSERRITIVSAGENDVERYTWPLPDAVIADLMERLLVRQPDALGIDIYRDRPVGDGGKRLAAQLLAHENVFWISKFGDPASGGIEAPSALVDSERTGFADIVADPGGLVRRGILFLDDGVTVDSSFSLRLALHHLASHGLVPEPGDVDPSHIKIGATTIAPLEMNDGSYVGVDARGYQYLLDYRYGPPRFPTIGIAEVLDEAFPSDLIEGKIVLVGVTSGSVKDSFYTPFSRGLEQTSFGVELHGEMVSQILRHAFGTSPTTRSLDEIQEGVWILSWTLLGSLVASCFRSPLWFVLAVSASVSGLLGAAYAAFVASWWLPVVPAALGTVGSAGLGASYFSYRERRERTRLMGLFSRHVSGAIAEEIWRRRDEFLEQGRPKPSALQATVLFADIRGFTQIAETLEPAQLVEWLNAYLETMARVVAAHGGIVDKFIGDSVMAVFGVPVPCRDAGLIAGQAQMAARCALSAAKEIESLNDTYAAKGQPLIAVRIGIHTGNLVAGSLGSAERSEYTVVGDTVNTASRLESFADELADSEARPAACTIAISGATLTWLGDAFATREIGAVQLKGKAEKVPVHHLLDFAGHPGEAGDDQS